MSPRFLSAIILCVLVVLPAYAEDADHSVGKGSATPTGAERLLNKRAVNLNPTQERLPIENQLAFDAPEIAIIGNFVKDVDGVLNGRRPKGSTGEDNSDNAAQAQQ